MTRSIKIKTVLQVLLIALSLVFLWPGAAHAEAVVGGTYDICPSCGVNYTYIESIWTYPRCTEDGYGTVYCDYCGYEADVVLPSTGHSYSAETIKEADCENGGLVLYSCTRCDYSYEQPIDALGHDMVYEDKEATCTEPGYHNGKCARCGKEIDEVIEAKGHRYPDNWTVVKEAGYLTRGLKTKTCTVCGAVVSEKIKMITPPVIILAAIASAALIISALIPDKKKKLKLLPAPAVSPDEAVIPEPVPTLVPKKKLMLCSEKEGLAGILAEKNDLIVRTSPKEELYKALEKDAADILLIDISDDATFEKLIEKKQDQLQNTALGLIMCGELSDEGRTQLDGLVRSGVLAAYFEENEAAPEIVSKILSSAAEADKTAPADIIYL